MPGKQSYNATLVAQIDALYAEVVLEQPADKDMSVPFGTVEQDTRLAADTPEPERAGVGSVLQIIPSGEITAVSVPLHADTEDTATDLSDCEKEELARLEAAIEADLAAFVRVGVALATIRNSKLYREHGTFRAYCQERWSYSINYADRLMRSACAYENLKSMPNGTLLLPMNEAQMRPLLRLQPEEQPAAWEAVLQRSNGKPTAKSAAQVIDELYPVAKPAKRREAEANNAQEPSQPAQDATTLSFDYERQWQAEKAHAASLQSRVEELEAEVARLQARVKELEAGRAAGAVAVASDDEIPEEPEAYVECECPTCGMDDPAKCLCETKWTRPVAAIPSQ